ncbi:SDR family NAD(P)-dependent oxidoreductase [Stenotrophomonas aracearum]|jgi:NAD(P)-dependent dehydrogenase (short-subunit alcohol dehydrogenase family)|uniref:SDR family NAD(P)-dependent oxidoreductase n=1 Tax=Stenotrophomonas aracearum TaxID=3003272 RepID=A0ABY9YCL4_9GAMM|nr:SDR family NAD(P)-dependent oxidoreductase [Stenotrophomonas sp. A5588]WNH48158.1 SDR family NAD(P)-dependent oxidoreductase [Stenotrophomonas sp. A5588]
MSEAGMQGRAVLVTGAASGIGAAVVARLRADGARVAALDLGEAPGADASAVADLRSAAAVTAAIDDLRGAMGPFDALVHCAGICPPGSTLDSDDAQWLDVYSVNVLGALRVIREVVPDMRGRGGSIVLVSSINARFATPGLAAYAASKAALEEMARTAALELAPDNIRVNTIAPASVDTPMLQASFARAADPAAARRSNEQRHPLGRLGTPQDAAELALFLASSRSGWITGSVFALDGGAGVTRR